MSIFRIIKELQVFPLLFSCFWCLLILLIILHSAVINSIIVIHVLDNEENVGHGTIMVLSVICTKLCSFLKKKKILLSCSLSFGRACLNEYPFAVDISKPKLNPLNTSTCQLSCTIGVLEVRVLD